jgi:hypothetical protein
MYKKPVQADDTFWRLEVNINPGKLDDFIAVAHDLFRTMDGEAGTLGYGYYLSDDKTVCHIRLDSSELTRPGTRTELEKKQYESLAMGGINGHTASAPGRGAGPDPQR